MLYLWHSLIFVFVKHFVITELKKCKIRKSTDNPDASKSYSINSWEIKKGASRACMRKCDERIARFYVTRTGCLICKVQRKVKMRSLWRNHQQCQDNESRTSKPSTGPSRARAPPDSTGSEPGPTGYDFHSGQPLGKSPEEQMDYSGQEERR